jgi:cyclic beta-1,2-glucan synthetase
LIGSLRQIFGKSSQSTLWDSQEIIRAEIFGSERFEQHAESLAVAQQISPRPSRGHSLRRRLHDNDRTLLRAYEAIAALIDQGRPITPAAEWLVDNYHIVEDQIREIWDDLPPGYYRQLPKLVEGPFTGYPRVLGIVWAFVAHTDSRFDPQLLCRYISAYQRIQPLTIGELWAIAITLRIVLVENLRRAADRMVGGSIARQQADEAADRLIGVEERAAEPVAAVLHPFAPALPPAFAVQLVQRLRDQDQRVASALAWLEERLAAQGTTTDAIVRDELQRQSASNVTVRNVITSMRLISAVDWTELVESVSLVDALLAGESDFAQMAFSTRDQYRRAIEEVARG